MAVIDAKTMESVDAIIRAGGRYILENDHRDFTIEAKGEANFVTEIDLAVEALIVSHFMQLTPDFAVITEEQESEPADLQKPTWILDPVDGTSNLMRGFRHSAISLALVDKGEPVIGLIYNPYTDEMFKAVSGQGASLNGQAIHVSQRAHMKDCLVGFGTTPYDRQNAHRTFELVETVFMRSFEIRRCGSAALDLAYVACGRLDVFFEMMLQPWDYAAGCLIITEAGGTVSNWKGEKPSLHHGDSVLASNGKVHPDVLKLLN